MKTSELRSEIKDYIYEILSEDKTALVTTQSGDTVAVNYKVDKELEKLKINPDLKHIKTATGRVVKEAIKKIKMMKEGDDKKQKIATLKNIVGKLKK